MALLSVVDLERDSKVSRYTWRSWIRQGRIPVTRLGRRVKVAEADYRAYLAAHRVPAEGEPEQAKRTSVRQGAR